MVELRKINSPLVLVSVGVGVALVTVYCRVKKAMTPRKQEPKPFTELSPKRGVNGDITKQLFTMKAVPKDIDAIVIGSGVGGLTAAACMAKRYGMRCLVLEQHDIAGGCCHIFEEEGFAFDTGLHYMGNLNKGTFNRNLFDYVTDGQLDWNQLGEVYDVACLGDREPFAFRWPYDTVLKDLKEKFPGDADALDKYWVMMKTDARATPYVMMAKWLPKWAQPLFLWWHRDVLKPMVTSIGEGMRRCGMSEELKLHLQYIAGDYGSLAEETPQWLHTAVQAHYIKQGSFYPSGGPGEIPKQIIPTVEATGGRCLVKAPVDSIIVERGAVRGVMVKGNRIEAPIVVSAAGFRATYDNLLGGKVPPPFPLPKGCQSPGHFYLFVGLEGSQAELKLPQWNYWVVPDSGDLQKNDEQYRKGLPRPSLKGKPVLPYKENAPAPFDPKFSNCFLGFPSAKDPQWDAKHPNKSTCVVLCECEYDWVSHWKDSKVKKRGSEYNQIKALIQERLLTVMLKHHPELNDRIVYMDVGSPLTNEYYLNAPEGASYGLYHDLERFKPLNVARAGPFTDVKGLYLAGQDTFCAGVVGGLVGGALAASAVGNEPMFVPSCGKRTPRAFPGYKRPSV